MVCLLTAGGNGKKCSLFFSFKLSVILGVIIYIMYVVLNLNYQLKFYTHASRSKKLYICQQHRRILIMDTLWSRYAWKLCGFTTSNIVLNRSASILSVVCQSINLKHNFHNLITKPPSPLSEIKISVFRKKWFMNDILSFFSVLSSFVWNFEYD